MSTREQAKKLRTRLREAEERGYRQALTDLYPELEACFQEMYSPVFRTRAVKMDDITRLLEERGVVIEHHKDSF